MTKDSIKKNDFIELEFTGKETDGKIFDTNIKDEAEKIGLEISQNPFIISVGNGMVVLGLDNSIEGKEIGKKYTIELTPEESFGKRRKEMVRLIPLKMFIEKKV